MGDWIRWVNVHIESIAHVQIRSLILQSVHQRNPVGSPLDAIEPLFPVRDYHPFVIYDAILEIPFPGQLPRFKVPD